MSKWIMQAHFQHLHFDSFLMIWKMPQCEVFCPLKPNSKISGVPTNSQVPISKVWHSSSHSSKVGLQHNTKRIYIFLIFLILKHFGFKGGVNHYIIVLQDFWDLYTNMHFHHNHKCIDTTFYSHWTHMGLSMIELSYLKHKERLLGFPNFLFFTKLKTCHRFLPFFSWQVK
jgi:hypothetical protein